MPVGASEPERLRGGIAAGDLACGPRSGKTAGGGFRSASRRGVTGPQRLHLRRVGGEALWADAVAEAHVAVLAHVLLDLLPEVLVVADLLAPGADRNEPLQPFNLSKRLLQLTDALLES